MLPFRYRILCQPAPDLSFYLYVSAAVFDECPPFFRIMFGKVPRSAAIRLCRFAWYPTILYEPSSRLILLNTQPERLPNTFQTSRQAEHQRMHHSAAPLFRRRRDAEMAIDGDTLKIRVERGFYHR